MKNCYFKFYLKYDKDRRLIAYVIGCRIDGKHEINWMNCLSELTRCLKLDIHVIQKLIVQNEWGS